MKRRIQKNWAINTCARAFCRDQGTNAACFIAMDSFQLMAIYKWYTQPGRKGEKEKLLNQK